MTLVGQVVGNDTAEQGFERTDQADDQAGQNEYRLHFQHIDLCGGLYDAGRIDQGRPPKINRPDQGPGSATSARFSNA